MELQPAEFVHADDGLLNGCGDLRFDPAISARSAHQTVQSLDRQARLAFHNGYMHIGPNLAQIVFLALIFSAQVRSASHKGCAAHATCRGASPRCAVALCLSLRKAQGLPSRQKIVKGEPSTGGIDLARTIMTTKTAERKAREGEDTTGMKKSANLPHVTSKEMTRS
ncbi:MAG: hypothetical protein ACTHXV_09335 [Canibacter sp.]